jgi:hypothetical protein
MRELVAIMAVLFAVATGLAFFAAAQADAPAAPTRAAEVAVR